jgi:hypothetical protein
MVLAMGARSVTLLGQDLSIGGGLYVGETDNDAASEAEEKVHLTCKGINGEMLPTLPNYFSFIGEFQNVAQTFKDQAKLINATAAGAFLEGWDHIPFSKHPLVTEDSGERYQIDVRSKSLISESRVQRVLEALADTEAQLDHAAKISEEIKSYCLASIESGDNDVTVIDLLEQRLKLIFDEECPVLRYYTSSQSLALTAAIGSVQSLEENLRLSADYYQSIGAAARKLMKSCQTSRTSMEGVIE